VSLNAPDGKRRTDAFRADQRRPSTPNNRHECSNGESVIVPAAIKLDKDPCSSLTTKPVPLRDAPLPGQGSRGG
jgi:hypothetical protein